HTEYHPRSHPLIRKPPGPLASDQEAKDSKYAKPTYSFERFPQGNPNSRTSADNRSARREWTHRKFRFLAAAKSKLSSDSGRKVCKELHVSHRLVAGGRKRDRDRPVLQSRCVRLR